MITIRVGSGKDVQDFAVYETLIRRSSTFVDNALKGSWRESTDRVITLPAFEANHFGIYHLWLRSGKLHSKLSPEMSSQVYRAREPVDESVDAQLYKIATELVVLLKLCHLGHYLLDTKFRDAVSDAILQCTAEMKSHGISFPGSFGPQFYKVIPQGSPSRSLVANLTAWNGSAQHIAALRACQGSEEHADFIMDVQEAVTRRFMLATPSTSPLEGWETSCKYHSHGDDKPCYRNKTKT